MSQKFRGVSSWVVLLSFISSPGVAGTGVQDVAGAVGNLASQAQYMIFNPTAQQLALQDPMAQLQYQMKQCEMGAAERLANGALRDFNVRGGVANLVSNKFKTPGEAGRTALVGARISDPANFDSSKFKLEHCDSVFPEPSAEPSSCSAYYGTASEPTEQQKQKGNDDIEKQLRTIANYRAFLSWKAKNCADRDQKALEAEIKVYECKQNAMKSAVAIASTQLQTVLQANQGEFKKGEQFVAEVGDQIRQVDEMLGPEDEKLAGAEGDAGNQFKGLFGIQRALNTQLKEMNTREAEFKTKIDEMKTKTEANEQTLESGRMGEVSKCMQVGKGVSISGGRALTCFVAKTDAAGKKIYNKQACGPMEWLKSQVSQSAFITSRGVMRDQRRTEESESFGAEFDSLQTAILRDLGAQDEKGEDGGKLVTRETNWNDISRKHSAAMQELSGKTGVNVSQQLNAIAGSCFTEADGWRKQQKRSMTSPYNKQKAEITKVKDEVSANLRNDLAAVNKSYGDAMSVLSGQVANVNRYNCTTDDPEKMQGCFVQMKQGVTDLLEGNGMSGTSKTITGGTQSGAYALPPVSFSCKGINGCITTLKGIRTGKKTQLATSQKVLVKFVNDSNASVKTQLSQFGTALAGLQRDLKAQFGKLNTSLTQMGASSVSEPASIESEALKQAEAKEGGIAGPYENPTSMSKVLSGLMQPDGMMNFEENGLKEVREAAKERADKKKEELEKQLADFKDGSKEFKDLRSECLASSSDKVNNLDCSPVQKNFEDYCRQQKIETGGGGGVATIWEDVTGTKWTSNNCDDWKRAKNLCANSGNKASRTELETLLNTLGGKGN